MLLETTPEFRAAIAKLIDDGTYTAAIAEEIADDPELA